MRKSRKNTLFALILLSFSSAVTLLVVEVGLRIVDPPNWYWRAPAEPPPGNDYSEFFYRPSSVPGLVFELAPNMKKVSDGVLMTTNSYGMRDREHVLHNPEPVTRIALLGDSFTFGSGVPVEDIFATVLENLLNESTGNAEPAFEVLNFGVGAYTTRDEAAVLQHKALAWRPDLVMIAYVLNDPQIDPVQPPHYQFQKPRLWQYSYLLRYVALKKTNWDLNRLGNGDYIKYLHADRRKWQSVLDAFEDIQEVSEREGVPVFLAILPMIEPTPWAEYPYHTTHEKVANAGRAFGFHVFDLYSALAVHPPDMIRVSEDDGHPNKLGHSLIAYALRDELLRERDLFFSERSK